MLRRHPFNFVINGRGKIKKMSLTEDELFCSIQVNTLLPSISIVSCQRGIHFT